MSIAALRSTICANQTRADCYDARVIASNLGAVSALTPMPDGRLMFIEDGHQVRIIADPGVSATIALPAEPARQLTGLAIDTQFEKSQSVFVAWTELARGVPGLSITRYREVENVLGEGATIATALPIAPDVSTPLAVDDQGLVYVAVPGDPSSPAQRFLNGTGVVMRFNRDGLVPRSNQNASPIVAEGYQVPLALTIDASNRSVWLTGVGHEQLGEVSTLRIQAMSRGTWPSYPEAVAGLGIRGERIDSIAIVKQAATADAELQLFITSAGRLFKALLTPGSTVARVVALPVGDSYFAYHVAAGGDGSFYVSVATRDGLTSVLKYNRRSQEPGTRRQ